MLAELTTDRRVDLAALAAGETIPNQGSRFQIPIPDNCRRSVNVPNIKEYKSLEKFNLAGARWRGRVGLGEVEHGSPAHSHGVLPA